jgi:hypothetical protein
MNSLILKIANFLAKQKMEDNHEYDQVAEDPMENPDYGFGGPVGTMTVEKELDSKTKGTITSHADKKCN